MIDQMRLLLPIATLCHVLGVSKSGYYARINRKPSARSLRQARLEVEILAAHKRNRKTYGAYRLRSDLSDHGVALGIHLETVEKKCTLRDAWMRAQSRSV
jgi:putative transposase